MDGPQRDESQSTASSVEMNTTQSPGVQTDSGFRSMNPSPEGRPQILKLAPLPGYGDPESKAEEQGKKAEEPSNMNEMKSQMMLKSAPRVSPETTAGNSKIDNGSPAVGKPMLPGMSAQKP